MRNPSIKRGFREAERGIRTPVTQRVNRISSAVYLGYATEEKPPLLKALCPERFRCLYLLVGSWIIHTSSDKTKVYTHPNFDLAKQYVDKIPMCGSEDSV